MCMNDLILHGKGRCGADDGHSCMVRMPCHATLHGAIKPPYAPLCLGLCRLATQ